jgi:hypothetical protein
MSKISKQQGFTAKSLEDSLQNIFLLKPGGCENSSGLIIEPCSVAITMNLGTSNHGNGVILPQNPPCFCGHFAD